MQQLPDSGLFSANDNDDDDWVVVEQQQQKTEPAVNAPPLRRGLTRADSAAVYPEPLY